MLWNTICKSCKKYIEMKEKEELILVILKEATERCFWKIASCEFWKCDERWLKILAKPLESISEGKPLKDCFLTFAAVQILRKVIE